MTPPADPRVPIQARLRNWLRVAQTVGPVSWEGMPAVPIQLVKEAVGQIAALEAIVKEAVDQIAALEAKRDKWQEQAVAFAYDADERDGLKAKIAQLRSALRSIANNSCCDTCQEAARVAQAALAPHHTTRDT